MAELVRVKFIPTILDFITYCELFSNPVFRFFFRCKAWINYSVCNCRSARFIIGLVIGQKTVDCLVVSVLVTYLTESWKVDNVFVKSVTIVNCMKGFSATLVIIMLFLSDTKIGRLKLLVYLTVIHILGLAMLTVCSLLKVAFGTVQIIAIFFLAAGKSITEPSKKFISDQLGAHEPKYNINEDRVEARTEVWYITAQLHTVYVVIIISGLLQSWPAIFAGATSLMAIVLVIFLYGTKFYHCKEPTDEAVCLADILSTVKAFFFSLKRQYLKCFGDSPNKLILCNENDQPYKDSKLLLKMLRLLLTFLGFGLGLKTADTIFPEQANNTRPDISITSLLILGHLSGRIIYSISKFIDSKWVPSKYCALVRIWLGMLLQIICFVVAALVESYRLETAVKCTNKQGLKTTCQSQMSTRWLVPQFCISGIMETLAVDGLDDFFSEQVPQKSLENYGKAFREFFIGIGNFVSVFCIHASGVWFGDTLNASRLDAYYMQIALICFINWCYCSYELNCYRKNLEGEEHQQQPENINQDPLSVPPLNIDIEIVP